MSFSYFPEPKQGLFKPYLSLKQARISVDLVSLHPYFRPPIFRPDDSSPRGGGAGGNGDGVLAGQRGWTVGGARGGGVLAARSSVALGPARGSRMGATTRCYNSFAIFRLVGTALLS